MPGCFIIDDESHAIELLSDYVQQTPGLILLGTALDPVIGLQAVQELLPDIIFLDVDMPKLSGLDLVNLLGDRFKVIFTTGHAGYAVEAFNLNAVDFLLKPIRYSRFLQSLDKVPAKHQPLPGKTIPPLKDYIFLQSGAKGKMVRILFSDIIYAESFNNYIVLHMAENKLTFYMSLKELLILLPADRFIRIHRSYLINSHFIRSVEGNRIFIDAQPELPIGKEYREAFIQLLQTGIPRKR